MLLDTTIVGHVKIPQRPALLHPLAHGSTARGANLAACETQSREADAVPKRLPERACSRVRNGIRSQINVKEEDARADARAHRGARSGADRAGPEYE